MFGILKLFVKFWWPLFLAIKFTFLFLNLGKIQIFIPKSTEGGWGLPVKELFLKKNSFFSPSLRGGDDDPSSIINHDHPLKDSSERAS